MSRHLLEKQVNLYSSRAARPHRPRRCKCTERNCQHRLADNARRQAELNSQLKKHAATYDQTPRNHLHCPHGAEEVCDCEVSAQPCLHTFRKNKNNNHGSRRTCDCLNHNCPHQHCEGRIKRVKGRVRRVGSAMAKYTAELAMLHLHWQLASECAPCKLNSITKRFCRRQENDNELYRSNSFNFKKFDRYDDNNLGAMAKEVSLCDLYSVPVDFIHKKRLENIEATVPHSKRTCASETPKIEVLEQYCNPKDQTNDVKPNINLFSSPISSKINNWRKSYAEKAEVSHGVSCDNSKSLNLHHSSPYYYGDLFKPSTEVSKRNKSNIHQRGPKFEAPSERSNSLSLIPQQYSSPKAKDVNLQNVSYKHRFQDELDSRQIHETGRSLSITLTDNEVYDALNAKVSSRCINDWDCSLMPPHRLPTYELPGDCAIPDENKLELLVQSNVNAEPVYYAKVNKVKRQQKKKSQPNPIKNIVNKINVDEDSDREYEDEEDDAMARQRHIYETAFDSKISKPENDIENLDKMVNHSLFISKIRSDATAAIFCDSSSTDSSKKSQKVLHKNSQSSKKSPSKLNQGQPASSVMCPRYQNSEDQSKINLDQHSEKSSNILQELKSLHKNPASESIGSPKNFSCNSTTAEFNDLKELPLNLRVLQKQEHLPQSSEDLSSLPCDDRAQLTPVNNKNHILEIKDRPTNLNYDPKELILEFKDKAKERALQNLLQQRRRRRRSRPRSTVCEKTSMIDTRSRPEEIEDSCDNQDQAGLLEVKLRNYMRRQGYSSTESIVISSSSGSMESLRSSTSEGNRSTSSSESRQSNSLSSHSSDGNGCLSSGFQLHLRNFQQSDFYKQQCTKLQILSPISDKSIQEPASDSDSSHNSDSQKNSPTKETIEFKIEKNPKLNIDLKIQKQRTLPKDITLPTGNFPKERSQLSKNLNYLPPQSSSFDTEVQGSDSGISIESRTELKFTKPFNSHSLESSQQPLKPLENINQPRDTNSEFLDLPFDMPKLHRRRLLPQQDTTTSGSATSVDLTDLPFDMPKLRRRLKNSQNTVLDSVQSSSERLENESNLPSLSGMRPKLSLDLDDSRTRTKDTIDGKQPEKPTQLSLGLSLESCNLQKSADLVDTELPLERQGWYHGSITRIEAEKILRSLKEGSYLVRNSESTKQDYSLSLKSAKGFMHMRIQKNEELNAYILGQFSKPFTSIPEMVRHFSINRLPIRGAEHMCLLHPVIAQLL